LHGNLFYFGRNSALDARNFFDPYPDPQKPQLRRHQYGATIGGPIQKDKTFFFFGFQGQRQFQLVTKLGTVPLPDFWNGDFSRVGRITDPLTKQAFPGNVIPANRISQQALQYRQYYPVATDLTKTTGNYTARQPAPDDYRLMNGRLDHTFSANHSIFGSY